MPLTPMRDLLRHAEEHRYAAGYFEAWNLESRLAVKDAAVRFRSLSGVRQDTRNG